MPKGIKPPLEGFTNLDRMAEIAALGRKVARVVAGHPVDVANEALRSALRYDAPMPVTCGQVLTAETKNAEPAPQQEA